jgi:hypothetical protein
VAHVDILKGRELEMLLEFIGLFVNIEMQ